PTAGVLICMMARNVARRVVQPTRMNRRLFPAFAFVVALAATAHGQPPQPARASVLRGEYGRYRANNDLLFYHLDVRVDPEKKTITGRNTIRFRMLAADTRIQLDLYA